MTFRKHNSARRIILTAIVLLLPVNVVRAQTDPETPAIAGSEVHWLVDMDEGKREAAASGKPMLAIFTGSDWCPTCMRLDEEIINHSEFAEYVNDAFVCVKIDVLSDMMDGKIPNPYEAVMEEYQVTAYPSVLILDSAGKVVARKGGQDGGPVPYVEMLKGVVERIGEGAGGSDWLVDFDVAKQKAQETGKPLLVAFTGSDWCGYCIALEDEVFAHDEFMNFAKGVFVCVKIDVVSDMMNGVIPNPYEGVIQQYQIGGYPSVLIMDPQGTVLASEGYQEGGPKPYVEMLTNILQEAGIEVAVAQVEEELIPFARTQDRRLDAIEMRNLGEELTLETAVFLENWPLVKQLLSELPEEQREETFTAITEGMKAGANHPTADMGLFSLDDVFQLSNCSTELTEQQIENLGSVLSAVTDYSDFEEAVQKDYLSVNEGRFGDGDAVQRDNTYQLLRAAGWPEAADQYLLEVELAFESKDVTALEKRVARLFEHVSVKHDDEKLQQALEIIVRMHEESLNSPLAGEEGFADIIDGLFTMNMEIADLWLGRFFQNNKDVSADFFMNVGSDSLQSTKANIREATKWLWLHDRVTDHFLVNNHQITDAQQEALNSLAASWMQVAPKKIVTTPAPWVRGQAMPPEVRTAYAEWQSQMNRQTALRKSLLPLLPKVAFYAPQGQWLRQLRPELAGNVMAARTQVFIIMGEPEQAIEIIIEHAAMNRDDAFDQANGFLASWMKAMGRDEGEPLTAAMQSRSKALLFDTLETFQDLFEQELDTSLVLDAFTSIHVGNEIFRREDVDRLLEQLDDPEGRVVSGLASVMALRLRNQWIGFNDARPNRAYQDLFAAIEKEYGLLDELLDNASEEHPDNWELAACLGGLRLNAATFHLVRQGDISLERREDVLSEYKDKRDAALASLQSATERYARAVSVQDGGPDNIGLLVMRFEAALSIPELAAASNLAGARDQELAALREDILGFEGRASEECLSRFVDWFTGSFNARDMRDKYAYLSGAVKIQVGDHPSEIGNRTELEKQLSTYDEWLREIRFVAQLDGDASVGIDQDFGLFVTIQHSLPVGETSDFDDHLSNQDMLDLFALRLENTIRDDFLLQGVVFHETDVKGYTTEDNEGTTESETETVITQETPFAYVVLRAKNENVRQVPPLEIILPYPNEGPLPTRTETRAAQAEAEAEAAAYVQPDFGNLNCYLPLTLPSKEASGILEDSDGRAYEISMPVLSSPLDIEVGETGAKRPCRNIVVSQTFDERLLDEGRIRLNITAEGVGLIPELSELLDIEQNISGFEIKEISGPRTSLLSFRTEERLSAMCSRSWNIELAVDRRNKELARRFTFPASKDDNIEELTNMRYNYGKLEPCEGTTIDIGWIPTNIYTYFLCSAGLLLIVILSRVAYPYVKTYVVQYVGKHKYRMPDHISPFTVARLIRLIEADPDIELSDQQRQELLQDATAIDELYFQQKDGNGKDLDLKSIASRWISTGKATAG